MCGIAGIWNTSGRDVAKELRRLRRMEALLTHRGPDDRGFLFLDENSGRAELNREGEATAPANVLLAHRRLSIIDVTPHGWQPMHNEDRDIFLVFNGEIYNYLELRRELEARNHVFASHTDSEVILHAYEEWGTDCCRRFNGMWAYALWDQRKRTLICSRDRFGIKPLFYAERKGRFVFGSEVKAVLAGLGEPARPDYAVLSNFLVPDWRPRSDLVYVEGIRDLKPAHQLVVTRAGTRVTRYWDYDQPTHAYDFSAPERTFRELFADAVKLRLRSDVPVAILLSAGLDSTSIAAFAAREPRGYPMNSFTAVYPGLHVDEDAIARDTAARFGMPYHAIEYNPDDLVEDLAAVTRSQDLPPFSSQVLPRWRLLRRVAEHGKVVLEGQGADELLGGYISVYFFAYLRDELRHFNPVGVRDFVARLGAAGTTLMTNLQGPRSLRHFCRYYGNMRAMREIGKQMLTPELRRHYRPGPSPDFRVPDLPDYLARKLHRDHAEMLLPSLMRFGDSISMAHSVESRLPFLDYRLVEYVFQLPYVWKIHGAWTKNLLRRAFEPELPAAVRNGLIKRGFNSPINRWLGQHIDDTILPMVCGPTSRTRDLYDVRRLRANLVQCRDANWLYTDTAFRALGLELWFREYIDRDWSENSAANVH